MIAENPNFEQSETPEQLPSQAEIKFMFDTLLAGHSPKELRVLSDEKGVSVYEVEVTLENGEKIEFNYQPAKYDHTDPSLPPGGRFSASIHATYYDADGMPYFGKCVANYLDGKWEMVS